MQKASGSTVRYGRMPEYKKATLCAQLEAECQSILALRPISGRKLADGARALALSRHLDLGLSVEDQAQVEQVVDHDFYHGGTFAAGLDVMWGAGGVASRRSLPVADAAQRGGHRGRQSIGRLNIGEPTARRKREQRRKALTYFRNQRERMRLRRVSAGQSAHRGAVWSKPRADLVSSRLKRSGMRWGMAAANRIDASQCDQAIAGALGSFYAMISQTACGRRADGPKVLIRLPRSTICETHPSQRHKADRNRVQLTTRCVVELPGCGIAQEERQSTGYRLGSCGCTSWVPLVGAVAAHSASSCGMERCLNAPDRI